MSRKLSMLVAIALLLAACGTSEPEVLPEEPSSVAAMDAAVHVAAQALLEQESIPIAVIYFGFDDPEKVVRYEWIDYRASGDVLAVYEYLDQNDTVALSHVQGTWAMARASDEESQSWSEEPSLGTVPEVVPTIGQLIDMTTQETGEVTDHDPALSVGVTRQGATDESELWTLTIPQDADGTMATRQWIINPDGVLQFYRIHTDTVLFGGDVGTIVFEYGVVDGDPDPLIVPTLGSPLLPAELGIPEPLLDIDQ